MYYSLKTSICAFQIVMRSNAECSLIKYAMYTLTNVAVVDLGCAGKGGGVKENFQGASGR